MRRKDLQRVITLAVFCAFVISSPTVAFGLYDGTDGLPTTPSATLFTSQSSRDEVTKYSGAYTKRFPLDIPPGRNGLQPDIALEYNSQATADSLVGYGWQLSIPYMERLNKTGSERLYADNYFSSSLGGELATTTASTTQYFHKVEDGRFLSYSFANNSWVAYDKSGTRYTFGGNSQARQFDAATSSNVTKWMLEEIRDTNDNFVRFVYLKDNNEIYPSQILYTGNGSTDGPMTITFSTSTRPDPYVRYLGGVKVTTNYRITEIKALVDGDWVRKHTLSYTTGNNGVRSMLSSIQTTGKDADDTELSLPATTFTYTNATTTSFVTVSTPGVENVSYVVTDVNGNGVNDTTVFYFKVFDSTYRGYIDYDDGSEVTFSNPPVDWANLPPSGSTYLPTEGGARFFDVNGDGWADAVKAADNYETNQFVRSMYISSTTSVRTWTEVASTSWSGTMPPFVHGTADGNYSLTTGLLGEVNGDGVVDYVSRVDGHVATEAHIGTGLGWNSTSTIFAAPYSFPGPGGTPMKDNQLIDINGDGLDDWVYSDGGIWVRLNTGTGWEGSPDTRWFIATTTLYGPNYWDRGMRFLDINGDGLVDFVRSYKMPSYTCPTCVADIEVADVKIALLNTGSGWATSTSIVFPSAYITQGYTDGGGHWMGDLRHNEYANMSGNGQKNQDVLTGVGLPTGGSISIEYTNTGGYATHAALPVSLLVVSRVTTNDNNGNAQEVNYTYDGGAMYFAEGVRERKLAGFGIVTEQSPLGKKKSYFHQGNVASTTVGELTDHRSLIGRVYREDVLSPSGDTLRKTFNRFETTDLGNGRTFAYRTAESVQDWEGGTSHKDRATEYAYSTSTGEVLQVVEKGEVTGNSDGTYSDTGSDARFTSLSYAVATSTNLAVPTSRVLKNNASTTVQETRLYYDDQAFGSTTKGNRTKDELWIAGGTYASTTKTFNQYGLVSTSTDARGATTSFAYDSLNLYPATTTNALNQLTGYLYDYATGKPTRVTDPNGLVRTTTFDPVGRVSMEKQPDITTPSTLVTSKEYTYTDDVFPSSIRTRSYFSSSTSTDAYVYRDGIGRNIQARAQVATSTYVVTDSVYAANGLMARQSLPYVATSSARSTATTTTSLFTTYSYDALQRATSTITSVGSTIIRFMPWKTRTTDALGNYKDNNFDALGNLASVVEYNDTDVGTTTYAYDAIGNLASTTDALGNVRSFTYDGLSRRLTAQDVHDASDGTFGTWSYAYDRAGNIASTTDPKSQVVSYTYDALNRVTFEDYTGASGTEVSYLYDFCTYGKGKLCVASSTEAHASTAYNALGLVSAEAKRINGTAHASTTFDYDRQGNATTVTYPDGREVVYGYDIGGRIEDIKTRTSGGAFGDILTRATYAAHGQPARRTYGNAVAIPYSYYANQQYRLERIGEAASSTTSGSGYSLDLESSSSQYAYISDASQTGLDFSNDLTFSTWVKFESLPANNTPAEIITKRHSSGNRSYYFSLENNGGTLRLYFVAWTNGVSDSGVVTANWTPSTDTWYHIGVTKDDTTVKFYVDGAQQGTNQTVSSATVYNGTAAFEVGNYSEEGHPFDGKIDDVRVWSRTLSGSEIAAIYTDPVGASNGTNLEGHWQLDNAYTDASGNGNTLTGQNSPVFSTDVPAYGSLSGGMQSLTYTYDAVGNILTITDLSSTLALKTISYTYDDLNRLLTASTTAASSTPFREVYRHNALGNLLYKGNGNATSTGSTNTNSLDLERGSSQYASIADASQTGLDFSNALTFAGWVKFETDPAGNDADFVAKRVGSGGQRSYLFYMPSASTLNLEWQDDGTNGTTAGVTWNPTTGTWYHIAVTKSGTTVKFYVDGSQQGTDQTGGFSTIYNGTAPFNLGGWASESQYTDGLMDDWRVWSRALSGSEISSLYSNPGSFDNGSSLQGSWQLDNNYSDASGNANTLTGQGSPVFASDVPYTVGGSVGEPANNYTYDETNYANPHAPTGIWVGYATSTLVYDANGNVTQYGTTTGYTYDYRDRMNAAGVLGATSTYGYDHTQQRMRQTLSNGTRTDYPNKFYSIVSSVSGATTTATSTAYIWQGDTMVAYIEQLLINGVASGTPRMYFTHPDHLGSTNVVTNASGTVVQTLDYYPYGSARIDSGSADSARKFIGQFADDPTALSYLNARYYDPGRGQFTSQDPVFWEVGQTRDGRAVLSNPQAMNSYSYAEANPVVKKDPTGRCPLCLPFLIGAAGGGLAQYGSDVLANRAAGMTGAAAYAPRSSWQEYNASIITGMGVGVAGTGGILYGGAAAILGSAVQDKMAGRDISAENAFVSGVVTVATGGVFKGLIGGSPASLYMQATGRSFNNLPAAVFKNDLRYFTSNELFSSSVSAIVQSRYQAVQNYNTSSGASAAQSKLWVTPSGAVVTWGGSIVAGPAAQSTPATITK